MLKLFLLIFIITSLFSKEPTLAILNLVISNTSQKFSIRNYSFECRAYGVVSIEDVMQKNSSSSSCRDSLNNLYSNNNRLQYFSDALLKSQQMYSLEFKNSECLLYANGQKTLSEFLLEEGLAALELNFKDNEFRYSFVKAELRAKRVKKGIWSKEIGNKCLADFISK